jgi:lysophospholipase L1-like esterase
VTHLALFLCAALSSVPVDASKPPGGDWAALGRYREENARVGLPDPAEKRVVFFGDSITEGWVSTAPAFFEGRPYLVRGIGGQTTAQMLVRFRQDVIALKPQAVVILAGTNDIAGNTGPYRQEDTFGHLKSMVELARARGIHVVLASILPARDYPWSPGLKPARKIMALNTLLRAYAEQNGLIYLDYHSAMADADGGLKASLGEDGVHPNQAGYDLMGALAERALQKALAAR